MASQQPNYMRNKLVKLATGEGLKRNKGKLHPITCYEGPKGEYRYSSTLSLTKALDGVVA